MWNAFQNVERRTACGIAALSLICLETIIQVLQMNAINMVTTKQDERFSAFVIDVDCIERLWKLFESYQCSVSAEFGCSDKTRIECNQLAPLKEFQNSTARRILFIEFSGERNGLRTSIVFEEKQEYGGYIRYSVRGKDSEVLHMSRAIEEIIASTRMWYSSLVAFEPYHKGMLQGAYSSFSLAATTVSGALAALFYLGPSASRAHYLQIALAVSLFLIVSPALAPPIIRFLFPAAIFAIGDGKARAENARFWRNIIGGGVILAIVVGLITAFLYEKIH